MARVENQDVFSDAIVNHIKVQAELESKAKKLHRKAQMRRNAHIDKNHVEVTMGRTKRGDWAVTLSDERGEEAAFSIELGHYTVPDKDGNRRWVDGMEALYKADGSVNW